MTQERFSIIVVPDTQNVITSQPEMLINTCEWIVDQAEPLNIKMVLHVGDVVNDGAETDWHWDNHHAAFDRIDEANIPMMIAIGNHDYDNLLEVDRGSSRSEERRVGKECRTRRARDSVKRREERGRR